MTLKEKFKNIDIKLAEDDFTYLVDVEAIKCEKIADEFAIGFAEWLLIIYNEDIIYDAYTKKELLEIYKKEKNL